MKLAWNLFLKDQRVLRWWLVAWWVALIVYAPVHHRIAIGDVPLLELWDLCYWLVGGFLLISLIHQEPVVRSVDYWMTKPMRPKQLLLGKALYGLVHFVLIPAAVQWVVFHFSGLHGHMGQAFMEWAAYYGPIMIAIACVGVVTRHLGQAVILSVSLLAAFVTVKGLTEQGLRAWGWNTTELRWWFDSPRVIHFEIAIVVIIGSLILLNQYLSGRFWRSYKLIGFAFLALLIVNVLPIRSHQSPLGELPNSSEKTDAIASTFSDRIAPLRDPNPNQPHIDLYVPTAATVMVDPRSVRYHCEGERILPRTYPAMWRQSSSNANAFLQLAGAQGPDIFSNAHPGWQRLRVMELDEETHARHVDCQGLLEGEVIILEDAPDVEIRLPLTKGANFQRGAYTFTLEGFRLDMGRRTLFIRQDLPVQAVTKPKSSLLQRGLRGDDVRLFHRPTKTLVDFNGGGGSSHVHPLAGYERIRGRFPVREAHQEYQLALLRSDHFDPDEWEVLALSRRVTASTRTTFEVPDCRLATQVPQTEAEFLTRLKSLRLGDYPDVESYLWDLWSCWSLDNARSDRARTAFTEKLMAVPAKDLSTYVSVCRKLGPTWRFGMLRAIQALGRLVGPQHRQLILENHDIDFDLLEILQEQGWVEEALPAMVAKSQRQVPPTTWDRCFIDHLPNDLDLVFQVGRRSLFDSQIRKSVLQILSPARIRDLAETRWEDSKVAYHVEYDEALRDLLLFGSPKALPILRDLMRGHDRKLPNFVGLLSTISDCSAELPEAQRWLEAHAETAVFNTETERYATIAKEETL